MLGLHGMPRRVYTYLPRTAAGTTLNLLATVGAFVIALGVLRLHRQRGVRSLRRGALAGDNPWDAATLEWATTSPPPPTTSRPLPRCAAATPLLDAGGGSAGGDRAAHGPARAAGHHAARRRARPPHRAARRPSGRSSSRSAAGVIFIGAIFTPWACLAACACAGIALDRLVLAQGRAAGRAREEQP